MMFKTVAEFSYDDASKLISYVVEGVSFPWALHLSIRLGVSVGSTLCSLPRAARLRLQVVRPLRPCVAVAGTGGSWDSLSAGHRPRWRPLAQRRGRPREVDLRCSQTCVRVSHGKMGQWHTGAPLHTHLTSSGSLPPHHDSFPDAGEAIHDIWSMSGNFIFRRHVEPRVKLYSPREELLPIPLKDIDVSRTTRTNLDVKQEKRIDDCWNIDGSRDLSDPWTGFTQFTLLHEKSY